MWWSEIVPSPPGKSMNYRLCSELNNLGVAFLDNGDLMRALDLFSGALTHITCEKKPGQYVEETKALLNKEMTNNSSVQATKSRQSNVAHEAKQASTSNPFVHLRGITLVASPNAYSPDLFINTTVISTVVTFNLAIVYHLTGLEGGSIADMRLMKAHYLYQKSHYLLADAGIPLGSTGNATIDVLSMALFNNLAQCSFELASYGESRWYFDQLISFAVTVAPTLYGDAHVGAILDGIKSNFLLNAIILHAPKVAPAA